MVWLHYCTVWAADNLCVSSVTEPQELCLALIMSLEKMSVIQLEKKNMHRRFRAKRKDWSRGECPPNRHAAASHGQHFPHLDTCTEAGHLTCSPQWNTYSYRPCHVQANMGEKHTCVHTVLPICQLDKKKVQALDGAINLAEAEPEQPEPGPSHHVEASWSLARNTHSGQLHKGEETFCVRSWYLEGIIFWGEGLTFPFIGG